jgi:hypothetical protein
LRQPSKRLQRVDFVQCYQAERHRYYWLCRWDEWQSLSKPAPSKYPAPLSRHSDGENPQELGGVSHHPQGNPGKPWETYCEGEGEEEQNHLTVNDALTRIVAEYHTAPTLSLLGEADAAREWIEDRQRNKKEQHLTPAFFRRWLKREHEGVLLR